MKQIALALRTLLLVLMLSPAAVAQVPPLWYQMPNGDPGLRLEVTGTVEDNLGLPWTGCVACQVEIPSTGFTLRKDVQPEVNGDIVVYLYLPLTDIGSGLVLSVMANSSVVGQRSVSGPFLDPIDGTGAHRRTVASGDSQVGLSVSLGNLPLSVPPFIGSILLTTPSPPDCELFMSEGFPGRHDDGFDENFEWSYLLPVGTTSIDLYAWSSAPYWDFYFIGAFNYPMVADIMRRGANPVGVNLPIEVLVGAVVDEALYPFASQALLVDAADHQPDATLPVGSLVSYAAQKERARARSWLKPRVPGTRTGTLFSSTEGGVVEIWGLHPQGGGLMRLIAYQAVPLGQGLQTVTF